MSAIQMIIANIQILNDAERAQVLSHFGKGALKEVGAGAAKELEPKKQNANKGKPTCHGDFVKKILAEQKDAVLAFKEANKEMKGAQLVFVANYKKENAGEFAIFEATWKEAHPKPEVATSVASDSEPLAEADEVIMPNEKPKGVMSEEQKAKMKAGHGEVPEAVAEPEAKVKKLRKPMTEEVKAAAALKRAVTKAAKA